MQSLVMRRNVITICVYPLERAPLHQSLHTKARSLAQLAMMPIGRWAARIIYRPRPHIAAFQININNSRDILSAVCSYML